MKTEKTDLYGKIAVMALLDFARCDPRLTAQSVLILQALVSRVGQDTIGLRTQASIAYEMGISRSTVAKHEKRLIACEYVTKSRRKERGVRNKFIYKFDLRRANQPTTPEALRNFREKVLLTCEAKSNTPNGIKQRYPQKKRESAPPNGCTRKHTRSESESAGLARGVGAASGFKPISVPAERLLAEMLKK